VTRPEQKARELAAVKRLRELDPQFPQGEIEDTDEPLDALVRLPSGGCVGIEVREFARDDAPEGSALNASQSTTGKVAAAAQDAYVALGGPLIRASLFFERNFRCKSSEIRGIAADIAAEVAKVAPHVSWSADINAWESGLPNGVEKIVLHKLDALKESNFAPIHTDFFGELVPEHIEYLLAQKESKVPAYRKKCSKVWLLVIADGFKLSGWAEPTPELTQRAYQTSFDRVVMLYDNSRVIELKPGA
jgi:hypothetical protein